MTCPHLRGHASLNLRWGRYELVEFGSEDDAILFVGIGSRADNERRRLASIDCDMRKPRQDVEIVAGPHYLGKSVRNMTPPGGEVTI